MKINEKEILFETDEEIKIVNDFFNLIKNTNRKLTGYPKEPGDMSVYKITFSEIIDEKKESVPSPFMEIIMENHQPKNNEIPRKIH